MIQKVRVSPQSGSKKETAAERSCIETHSGDYQAQLKCLSGTAGMSHAAPMHDCLANWLQTVVGKAALEPDSLKRGAGFTPQDLRKSFGELFQKTVGDFFQVKVAQFLNDTMDCLPAKVVNVHRTARQEHLADLLTDRIQRILMAL